MFNYFEHSGLQCRLYELELIFYVHSCCAFSAYTQIRENTERHSWSLCYCKT